MMADDAVKLKLAPADITMLNRIFEGYEHLGVVSTLDSKAGLVIIRSTPELMPQVRLVLRHLPFPAEIL